MQLYDWQQEAVEELTDGSGRVLVVAPTGGGKSMCFQQPAADLPGVAVVITPLVALMADQVQSLEARGIRATYLAANLDAAENARRAQMAIAGEVKLLYVAPERLASQAFCDEVLSRLDISLVAIDEAHCISQWGHDFRPEYLQIGAFIEWMRPRRLIALTATATPAVRAEIVERLGMPEARQILRGFARHNLRLSVEEVSGPKAKERRIADEVRRWLRAPREGRGAAIVYCASRRSAESTAEAMRACGWRAEHYHAGMDGAARTAVQRRFSDGTLDVIAATNAFGMGIDRADIRLVVHHTLPESVEAYYQEVGRAGRDGEPAGGLLMISDPDIAMRFRMIQGDAGEGESPEVAMRRRELLRSMIGYAETAGCRHDAILEYFEDVAEELGGCSQCDACVATAEGRSGVEPDAAESAQAVRDALLAIQRMPFPVGAGTIVSFLIGIGNEKVRQYGWQSREAFGVLKGWNEARARRLLRRCVAAAYLTVDGEHQLLRITRRGADVAVGSRGNAVRLPAAAQGPRRADAAASAAATIEAGGELLQALKRWRRQRADADSVPAYVICHDATLLAIAEARPTTSEELRAINGLGPAKVQRYGVQILATVRECGAPAGERTPDAAFVVPPFLDATDGAEAVGAAPVAVERPGGAGSAAAGTNGERAFSDYQLAIRVEHPRAFECWTPDEDERVRTMFGGGRDADAIAAALQRQPNGVTARLAFLGLTARAFSDAELAVRARYARAYDPWTAEEDARLEELESAGATLEEMAAALERQPAALRIRLRRIAKRAPAPA